MSATDSSSGAKKAMSRAEAGKGEKGGKLHPAPLLQAGQQGIQIHLKPIDLLRQILLLAKAGVKLPE
jgi:hypothetical protein